jgi:HlyD family secretion protein
VSSVDISAEVPGRIVALTVAEGDSVAQGDLLLRLDDAQYRSRVEQARAASRSAAANLALSEARLEKTTKDRDRLQALMDKDLASAEALEEAATNVSVQQADVEARRQELARNEAALLDAEDNLEKTVYRAPVTGVVSRLNVEVGEIVITGTMNNPGTVILTVSDLSVMEVEAEVDETDVVAVRPGQKASISVDAFPDTTFEGTVSSVGNSGRRQGQGGVNEVINFEVDVRFNTADPRLKPGMTADVEVETKTREDVLNVPIQSLVARSRGTVEKDRKAAAGREKAETADTTETAAADSLRGEDKEAWEKEVLEGVYAVVDGKAVFVPVKTGIADASRIEVTGDLTEGDAVVSGPYRVLRDLKEGTRIKGETSESEAD